MLDRSKHFILASEVKHLHVPFYDDLTLNDMCKWAGDNEKLLMYYPLGRDIMRVPRQWFINIAYSVVGEPFARWVHQRIEARNEKVKIKSNANIEMDPAIFQAFVQSTAVSLKKGTSHNILKAANKRRRTKAQIAEEKEAAANKQIEIQTKLETVT